jgi:hypothetical protein
MPALAIHPIVDRSVGPRRPPSPGAPTHSYWGDEQTFESAAIDFCRRHSDRNIGRVAFREDDTADFTHRILDYVSSHGTLDLIAIFGHGGPHSFPSAHIGKGAIASLLDRACQLQATIIFYACSCGELGTASVLGHTMATTHKDFRLFGHKDSGPSHCNPRKTRFITSQPDGREMIRLSIGELADVPRFEREWNTSFRNIGNWLWADYPFLPPPELGRRACVAPLEETRRANRRRFQENNDLCEALPQLYRILRPEMSGELSARRLLSREEYSPSVQQLELRFGLQRSSAWPAFPCRLFTDSDEDLDYFAIALAQWQHRHGDANPTGELTRATFEAIQQSHSTAA